MSLKQIWFRGLISWVRGSLLALCLSIFSPLQPDIPCPSVFTYPEIDKAAPRTHGNGLSIPFYRYTNSQGRLIPILRSSSIQADSERRLLGPSMQEHDLRENKKQFPHKKKQERTPLEMHKQPPTSQVMLYSVFRIVTYHPASVPLPLLLPLPRLNGSRFFSLRLLQAKVRRVRDGAVLSGLLDVLRGIGEGEIGGPGNTDAGDEGLWVVVMLAVLL